jgi:hypothetical protein
MIFFFLNYPKNKTTPESINQAGGALLPTNRVAALESENRGQ